MKRGTVFGIVCILLAIIFTAARVFYVTEEPKILAQKEAVSLMKEEVQFQEITDFYWFNTSETFYSIAGTTIEGNKVYAIVSPETKKVVVVDQAKYISEEDAKSITLQEKEPQAVKQARLGMIGEEPVWEVNYQISEHSIGYYYILAKNGQWIKDIENI
ncbi:Uncharacterized protein YpmB [Granulicatella balaenopterae]|uniref:Uncharacterized protein YpmB n=1 Tax=Granulicatella balaenopterae TaxID=137733 RepID=A0A1H9JZZ4_9LACT|nr:DUF5590 domain-containing protein [Granulicatella balaenopterae]SEQ92347.1 Uncharacterized protein YpmB [Granulicatella balaenopterae]